MASSTASIFTFRYVDAAETIAIGVTLPIVCIAVVALRFYTRTRQTAYLGIDDWLILGGVVSYYGRRVQCDELTSELRSVLLAWAHAL